ncbi:TPA: hypothetical protein QC100_005033 [Bacillus thuringiensis]|nr:hypothetical protein [Bacillus thuringiensis]
MFGLEFESSLITHDSLVFPDKLEKIDEEIKSTRDKNSVLIFPEEDLKKK